MPLGAQVCLRYRLMAGQVLAARPQMFAFLPSMLTTLFWYFTYGANDAQL